MSKQIEMGLVSMRNEDGTQWLVDHAQFHSWSASKREATPVSRARFEMLQAGAKQTRRHDSPDTGFFGVYGLTFHPLPEEQAEGWTILPGGAALGPAIPGEEGTESVEQSRIYRPDVRVIGNEEEPLDEEAEPDMNLAILFADSARGVYIPQHFAEAIRRDWVSGVTDSQYSTLLRGPDEEHYWEVWEEVMQSARLTFGGVGSGGTEYVLYTHPDGGDLWWVPVPTSSEAQAEAPQAQAGQARQALHLSMLNLLSRAVDEWPQFDDPDEEVNGGDMVEWFGSFRAEAKKLLGVEAGPDDFEGWRKWIEEHRNAPTPFDDEQTIDDLTEELIDKARRREAISSETALKLARHFGLGWEEGNE